MAGFVSNLGESNGEAHHREMEQLPVVISLVKVDSSKKKKTANAVVGVTNEDSEHSELSQLRLPREYSAEIFVMAEPLSEGFTKNVFWSRLIDFKIPDDCVACIMKWEEEKKATSGLESLPLVERLKGWRIEKRPRESNDRQDKYFYHAKSGNKFRSFLEAEAFLIHGRLQKRKRTIEAFCEITDSQKKLVEEFLEESWKNLQKIGKQTQDFRSASDEVKEHDSFATDN